jgi:hypothetical protein
MMAWLTHFLVRPVPGKRGKAPQDSVEWRADIGPWMMVPWQ